MEARGEAQVISAFIPLAETFQYATHVRSITTGRASFAMELDHYTAVPKNVAEKVSGN
jgi:elongation factor G